MGPACWAGRKKTDCQKALTLVRFTSTNKIQELSMDLISFGSALQKNRGILAPQDPRIDLAPRAEKALMGARTQRLFIHPKTGRPLIMESNRTDEVRMTPEGQFLILTDRSRHRPSRIVAVPDFYRRLSDDEIQSSILRLQDEPAVTDQVLDGSIIASLPDMSLMIVDRAFSESETASRDLGHYQMYFPDLQITRRKNSKISSQDLQGWDQILRKLRLAARNGMILKRFGLEPQITSNGRYLTLNLEIYSSKSHIQGYMGAIPVQVHHPYKQNLVAVWDLEKNELIQHFMSNALDSEDDAETTSSTALLPHPTEKRVFVTQLLENGDLIVARAHTQTLRDQAGVPTADLFLKLLRLSPSPERNSQIFAAKIEGLQMEKAASIGIPYISGGIQSFSISQDGNKLLLETTAPPPQDKIEVDLSEIKPAGT